MQIKMIRPEFVKKLWQQITKNRLIWTFNFKFSNLFWKQIDEIRCWTKNEPQYLEKPLILMSYICSLRMRVYAYIIYLFYCFYTNSKQFNLIMSLLIFTRREIPSHVINVWSYNKIFLHDLLIVFASSFRIWHMAQESTTG